MRGRANKLPKHAKHRASGKAVVRLNGVDHYLGPHGTKASKIEYDRLIGEWLAKNCHMETLSKLFAALLIFQFLSCLQTPLSLQIVYKTIQN